MCSIKSPPRPNINSFINIMNTELCGSPNHPTTNTTLTINSMWK